MRVHRIALAAGLLTLVIAAPAAAQHADLIITGGRVWTGDSARPQAEAVAVTGNRISAVGSRAEVMALQGPVTRVIDMPGTFITPGFIDNHTHFNSAGALLLGANLLDVSDEAGLIARVREARDRLPPGAWLTGGDWAPMRHGVRGPRGGNPFAPTVRGSARTGP